METVVRSPFRYNIGATVRLKTDAAPVDSPTRTVRAGTTCQVLSRAIRMDSPTYYVTLKANRKARFREEDLDPVNPASAFVNW